MLYLFIYLGAQAGQWGSAGRVTVYNCVFTQNRAALAGCMDRLDASKCTTVCSHRAERLWPGGDMLLAHFRQHTFFSRHGAHRASLHRTEPSISHLLNGLMRNTLCIVKPMILKLSRFIEVHNLDGPRYDLYCKTNDFEALEVHRGSSRFTTPMALDTICIVKPMILKPSRFIEAHRGSQPRWPSMHFT